MNKDIRLNIGFLDHPKTVKLEKRLDWPGVKGLLRLWFFCATNKPDGQLVGMDDDDIEIAAKWTGKTGAFIKTLSSIKWLDWNGKFYSIHDWAEHNEYVIHSKEREEKARRAAAARWEKEKDAPSNAPSMPQVLPKDAPSNALFPSLLFPPLPFLNLL
ncbi:MAG: hypothetical protein ABSB32_06045 [Thermodesulfobacteriota bacterium]|jgi:hypothetical protein